eukprot:gene22003-8081_t
MLRWNANWDCDGKVWCAPLDDSDANYESNAACYCFDCCDGVTLPGNVPAEAVVDCAGALEPGQKCSVTGITADWICLQDLSTVGRSVHLSHDEPDESSHHPRPIQGTCDCHPNQGTYDHISDGSPHDIPAYERPDCVPHHHHTNEFPHDGHPDD